TPTRPDLRGRDRAPRGDHPAPGLRRGGAEGDAGAGEGGPRSRGALRRGARRREPRDGGAAAGRARRAARGRPGRGAAGMSTFDRIADLPLVIDGYEFEGLEQNVSSGFLRKSTLIHLSGG